MASSILVAETDVAHSGMYRCEPGDAPADHVLVHVIDGEQRQLVTCDDSLVTFPFMSRTTRAVTTYAPRFIHAGSGVWIGKARRESTEPISRVCACFFPPSSEKKKKKTDRRRHKQFLSPLLNLGLACSLALVLCTVDASFVLSLSPQVHTCTNFLCVYCMYGVNPSSS